MQELNYILGIVATLAFAITGVLAISQERSIDLVGALVLGLATAVGGGTLRDLIMDAPVFWAQDLLFVWLALGASLVTFYARSFFERKQLLSALNYLDGLGGAMFAVQACDKVWAAGFDLPLGPILLGMITAMGGGVLRDVLAGRTNCFMRPELYATPVLLATSCYTCVLAYLPEQRALGSLVCIGLGFTLRALALARGWTMPRLLRS